MIHRLRNICPDCGAYLDPGERCDCLEAAQEAKIELVAIVQELPPRDLVRLNSFAQRLAGSHSKTLEQK